MKISLDFETYSESGYVISDGKWKSIAPPKHGLAAAGLYNYAIHPSTDIKCLVYCIDDMDYRFWMPGLDNPPELFIADEYEAHNATFEYYLWTFVCCKKYGWPPLDITKLYCSAAKARHFGLPGALKNGAIALNLEHKKDAAGTRLLNKISIPHNNKPATAEDYDNLYRYCHQDVVVENAISRSCPDLPDMERVIWLLNEKINMRGVQVDVEGLNNCIAVYERFAERKLIELKEVTGGAIDTPFMAKKICEYCHSKGVLIPDVSESTVNAYLDRDIPYSVRQLLEIRRDMAGSNVKKLYTMRNQLCGDGRLRNLFMYYGAERTGRFSGVNVQPQNLSSSGPTDPWGIDQIETTLDLMQYQNPDMIEARVGPVVKSIAGCLRGLFVAASGKKLVCSDYSAIEAVGLAAMAGEEWRLEVFRTHGKIYEMCASRITGIPFDEITKDHPARKKYGKIPELLGGYQGWTGALIRAGVDKFMSEQEMIEMLLKWRADSPMIAGIKHRGQIIQHGIWTGLEYAARDAILNPGSIYTYRTVSYQVKGGVLMCQLPSGRTLYYHRPSVGMDGNITYWGWNNNQWREIHIYGGKFTENVVQAVCRDILVYAMLLIEYTLGYPIVLDVHDEIVCEHEYPDVDLLEKYMGMLPAWCQDWPIKASGGWIGHRYRK